MLEEINENNEDYDKLILVKSSFKENNEKYETRRDKDKILSVEQYLKTIMISVVLLLK